jgi:hypothetical protein
METTSTRLWPLVRAKSAATAGHPARDGDCEKIRAGIPAAVRRVSSLLPDRRTGPIRLSAGNQFRLARNVSFLADEVFRVSDEILRASDDV